MKIIVTGGNGFLGARLVNSLLKRGKILSSNEEIEEIIILDKIIDKGKFSEEKRLHFVEFDISSDNLIDFLQEEGEYGFFHLGAMVSGECEAYFDKALDVNIQGTVNILNAAKELKNTPRFIFASSLAVFGGEFVNFPIGDKVKQTPSTTYGMTKSIGELLLNDYSRKGFIDGRTARLPTVVIRPGKSNAALSSFASAIFREPLSGRDYDCPVPLDTEMPIIGYRNCIECIIHLYEINEDLLGNDRAVSLPSIKSTVGSSLEALESVSRGIKLGQVKINDDKHNTSIVKGWPKDANNGFAFELGMNVDKSIDSIIKEYMEDYL